MSQDPKEQWQFFPKERGMPHGYFCYWHVIPHDGYFKSSDRKLEDALEWAGRAGIEILYRDIDGGFDMNTYSYNEMNRVYRIIPKRSADSIQFKLTFL